MSDWDVRGREIEQVFSRNPIPDNCIDAANRAADMFDSRFPGWQLYCRVIRGESIFDRQIAAWAIGMGRLYARMRKRNGRRVVRADARRNDWIAQAALDSVEFLVFGKYSLSSDASAKRLAVDDELYGRFRSDLTDLMTLGFQSYAAILHRQYCISCLDSLEAA